MTPASFARKPVVILVAVTLLGLATVGAAWSFTRMHAEPERRIKVDSWDHKHAQSWYEITFGSTKEGTVTVTGIRDTDLRMTAANGAVNFNDASPPEQSLVEKPDCQTQCWRGYALLELESRPGGTWQGQQLPMTRWVAWTSVVDVPPNGETVWTFKSHHPGVYGVWTMKVTGGNYRYQEGAWGDNYQFHETAPIRSEYEFIQG